jgi:hypothetical protein
MSAHACVCLGSTYTIEDGTLLGYIYLCATTRWLEYLRPIWPARVGVWTKWSVRVQRGILPNYQQTLGTIGRYLDQHLYDDLVLCELGDGFVGRVMQEGKLVEAIPFQSSDLANMIRAAAEEPPRMKSGPAVAPSPNGSFVRRTLGGYREFLTALGRQFDLLEANSVMIVELPDTVLVVYRRTIGPFDSSQSASCEFLYDESGMRKLLLGSAANLRI